MRHLFVMDPLDRIHVAGDSTYVLMRECTDRGWEVAWCTPDALGVRDGQPFARVTTGRVTEHAPWFHPGSTDEQALGAFDVVWMRKDPPFDMDYVLATYVLDLVAPPTLVVNEPGGLKLFNEKIWAMRWARFQPPTLLSADKARIHAFVQEQTAAVLKPWDGNGGRGVLVTRAGDPNLNSMIELLTDEGRQTIIAQGYIERVRDGDKRILLFDGEPVGAINRIPGASDHRANMHVGASVAATELDARDREICDALGPVLAKTGMLFVGIDVIGGMLTEINVTSPTGIREVNALYGKRLEADLLDRAQRLHAAGRS